MVGQQIKLARLRRNLSMEQLCERILISRNTLSKVEKGDPSVAFGIYVKVLYALGLDEDILFIAKDDVMGRVLQDMELTVKRKAEKK